MIAWLRLADGVTRDQVDDNQPLTLYPGGINSMRQYVFEYDRGGKTQTIVLAFFDRSKLLNAVNDNGRIELRAIGKLKTGQYFYGDNNIWILK